ncbi:MAG: ATP-binding protein [Gemmatimonadaceae bacterium]
MAAAALATLLSWLLRDMLSTTRLLLLWVASVFIAWRGGAGPVLVTALLGVLGFDLLLTRPDGQRTALTLTEILTAAVYIGVSYSLGRTADALRRARARVAQATDGMTNAMFVMDATWRVRFMNSTGRSLLRRLGIESDAIRGRIVWEAVPSLLGTVFEGEARRALDEQRVIEFEERLPEADLWLRVRLAPTSEGGIAVFVDDITLTQRAELERRRTEDRYHALVEASTVMVWSADPNGMISDMPVWRELTGQTTDELRGSGWADVIHPHDRIAVSTRWADSVRDETPYDAEYRLRHRDGRYRWYRARAVPVREEGRIVEWVGVFDDVHEEHVRHERHSAVDNALGVLGTSLDYEWNLAAVTRLLVPTLADYCSVDVLDEAGALHRVSTTHTDPQQEVLLRELWKKYPYRAEDPGSPEVIRSGRPQLMPHLDRNEILRFARSSEHREMLTALAPSSYLCVPMSSRGQVFGSLSLVYANSGRVYGAAELAAVEQIATRAGTAIENARLYADAQAGNRAKSDFLATMSHELRTPLNAIAGYTELLAMEVRGPVNDDQRRDLARIRQNQQHLLEIINDILNFSRLEAGRTRFALTALCVADVLERMEAAIEPQLRARGITYECVQPSRDVVVTADREKLEQVLINLLGNAVKFTQAGGRVWLGADVEGDVVRIHVRDTGVGIARADLGTIFEPFVQLQPAFTRTTEGTGLGLAIARDLARHMGGDLTAESEPGRGSVFTVVLPRAVSA